MKDSESGSPALAAARATPTASGTLLKVIALTRSTPARRSVAIWTPWYSSASSAVIVRSWP